MDKESLNRWKGAAPVLIAFVLLLVVIVSPGVPSEASAQKAPTTPTSPTYKPCIDTNCDCLPEQSLGLLPYCPGYEDSVCGWDLNPLIGYRPRYCLDVSQPTTTTKTPTTSTTSTITWPTAIQTAMTPMTITTLTYSITTTVTTTHLTNTMPPGTTYPCTDENCECLPGDQINGDPPCEGDDYDDVVCDWVYSGFWDQYVPLYCVRTPTSLLPAIFALLVVFSWKIRRRKQHDA